VLARPRLVLLIGVGHLDRQKEIAARIAPLEKIASLGGSKIVLALFLAYRGQPQRHLVLTEQAAAAVQIQLVLRLVDDHAIRGRDLLGGSGQRGRRSAGGQQNCPQTPRAKPAAGIEHI
jgi:hypothetical protein